MRGHLSSERAVEMKAENTMVKYYDVSLRNRAIGMIQAGMSQSLVANNVGAPLRPVHPPNRQNGRIWAPDAASVPTAPVKFPAKLMVWGMVSH